jgi:hypothetical protein
MVGGIGGAPPAAMIHRDVPITREAYIQMAYGKEEPAEWTPEHESNLPPEPQDWSIFEKERKSRRRTQQIATC